MGDAVLNLSGGSWSVGTPIPVPVRRLMEGPRGHSYRTALAVPLLSIALPRWEMPILRVAAPSSAFDEAPAVDVPSPPLTRSAASAPATDEPASGSSSSLAAAADAGRGFPAVTWQQAVFALQKAAGIGRDGTVGAKTWKALADGVRPKAKSTTGKIVEIDLKRQLLLLVEDGEIKQIFNTSTGSMEYYQQEGRTYLADTPRGKFRVSRQIDGWRHAPLGLLWRPKYFNGGIAVHGAPSVPPYPASHGCARVSVSAMNWMWKNDALPLKTRVWVY